VTARLQAYGMAALPVDMMRGRKNLDDETNTVYSSLTLTKEKKRNINAKYVSGKKMSKDDARKVSLLSRQERSVCARARVQCVHVCA
jgi:hypothetical protein